MTTFSPPYRYDPFSWTRKQLVALLAFLLTLALLLLAADLLLNFGRIAPWGPVRRFFNVTREDSFASWVSVILSFATGLVFWMVCRTERRRFWLLPSLFFWWASMDDGSKFHERIGSLVECMLEGSKLSGFPTYYWHLVFLPILALIGVLLLQGLWKASDSFGRRLLICGLGCLALAVGQDFLEGLSREHPLNPYTFLMKAWEDPDVFFARRFNTGAFDGLRHIGKALEEVLEIAGLSFFHTLALDLLRRAREART